MSIFKPIKVKDPKTGEEFIISPEEQELLLEKGVLIDFPSVEIMEDKKDEQ